MGGGKLAKVLWALPLAAVVAGCASSDAEEQETRIVYGTAREALTDGSIKALNGTYAGCAERTGAWSVRVSGNDALDHDALSVIRDDTSCVLAVTEVVADRAYVASPALPLTTSYQGTASSFSPAGGGPITFYANVKLSSATFASNFQITVAHSDDPSVTTTSDLGASYATVESSVVTTIVLAPDYTISLAALTVQTNVTKDVVAASGVAALTDVSRTGFNYVVNTTLSASPTLLEVTAAYAGGSQHIISGPNPTIPASEFTLVGKSLASPITRTVIISRTVGGVLAYQLFRITFKSP